MGGRVIARVAIVVAGVAACSSVKPHPPTRVEDPTAIAGSGSASLGATSRLGAIPAPGAPAADAAPDAPAFAAPPLAQQVVADFEAAVKTSQAAYAALFDYAAVGELEILLHRYDLNGRFPDLSPAVRAQFAGEDGTPYPAARERRNVGAFYPILAQRTVGTGGCTPRPPHTTYAQNLGKGFEALPAGTPPKYETLRAHANAWLGAGGVVAFACTGGSGGLAVVYTKSAAPRGYDLITIYDDTE